MMTATLQRLDQFGRQLLPFLLGMIFAVLGVVSIPIPHLGVIAPPFALMAVYYWSIHRPDLFGAVTCFFLGILVDALAGLPLGLNALCFVLVHQLALSQRNLFVSHSFAILWVGFAATMAMVMLLQWLVLSFFYGDLMPVVTVLVQTAFAIVIFPLPALLMILLQRNLLSTN